MKCKITYFDVLVYLAIICSFLGSGVSLGSVFGFAILPVRVIGIVCVLLLILSAFKNKNKRLKIQHIEVAYAYMLIVTLFFTENYTNSFGLLLDYMCVFAIFCVILLSVKDGSKYKEYRDLYLLCTLITILICFYEYLTQNHIASNYADAYSATDLIYFLNKAPTAFLYNPNNVAVLMVSALPLMLEKTQEVDILPKRLNWFVGIILDFAVIFMTGSRGGLVAGTAVLGIYFLASDIKLWKKVLVLIVGFTVAVYFSDFILSQLGYGGMLRNGELDVFADGDGGRISIARNALTKVFIKNPLFGLGAGAAENAGLISNHNTAIEVLCNYGIFGMCFFAFLIIRLLKRLMSLENKIISLLVLMAFFMSMVIPPTIMTFHALFIPLSLKVGKSYIEGDKVYEYIDYN